MKRIWLKVMLVFWIRKERYGNSTEAPLHIHVDAQEARQATHLQHFNTTNSAGPCLLKQCPATDRVRGSPADTAKGCSLCFELWRLHTPGRQASVGEGEGTCLGVNARATLCQGHGQQPHHSVEEVGAFWVHWAVDWPEFHHDQSWFCRASGNSCSW